MSLTKEQREKLPAAAFAVPGKRALPLTDQRHVLMARATLPKTSGLTNQEREDAQHRIVKKAVELGINTQQWNLRSIVFNVEAMALDMPDESHPNRMPFEGVLVRLDEPSDYPPHGSTGKRTFISKAVAEAAIPSLLGMAIDYTPKLDGHDKKSKIGIITAANVVGNAIEIAGFLYASDFPEECARIKAEKEKLGFSYECQASIADVDADPWVVTRCTFTGAAVLYKHLAAYTTTSLAAEADKEFDMTPEELKAVLDAAIAPLNDKIGALTAKVETVEAKTLEAAAMHDKVKPHAESLRACAAGMEAAGIGTHETQGHVNVLRHMAASMEADSMMGKVPHIYRDHDYLSRTMSARKDEKKEDSAEVVALKASIESLNTKVTDLVAKGFNTAAAPERKTFSPEIVALLTKFDLAAAANDGKLTIEQVDKALDGLPREKRMEQKLKLMASGALPSAKTA